MKSYYPIALKLENRHVLVVGGGIVAERKVKSLLASGALVKIVSPSITNGLQRLYSQRKISYIKRKYKSLDVATFKLVIAATNDNGINALVSKNAKRKAVLVNVVDNAKLSDFISPAVLRKNKAIIAVCTNGKDPVLSRDLKNFLKENWDDFLSYRNRL